MPVLISPDAPTPLPTRMGGTATLWRAVALVVGVAIIAAVGLARVGELTPTWRVVREARRGWLIAALGTQILPYLALTRIYVALFRQQGHPQPAPFLARVATVVLTINRVLPTMGVTSSVYLLATLRRRGVPPARTLVVHTLEIAAYAVAFTLVTLGGGFALLSGQPIARAALVATLLLITVAITGIWQRARRAGRMPNLAPVIARVARLLPARFRDDADARITRFVAEMGRGVRLAGAQRGPFARAVGWELTSLLGDCLTIGCALVAVGVYAAPGTVVIAFAAATALAAVSFLPGGAGSFEAVMVVVLVRRAAPLDAALAATLIFRALTFWLPLALALPLLSRSLARATDSASPAPTTL